MRRSWRGRRGSAWRLGLRVLERVCVSWDGGGAGALHPAPAAVENRPAGPLRAERRGQRGITRVGSAAPIVRAREGSPFLAASEGGPACCSDFARNPVLPPPGPRPCPHRPPPRRESRKGAGLRAVVAVLLGQWVAGFPDAETLPGLRVGRKREAGKPRRMAVETRWAGWGGVGVRTRRDRQVVERSDGGCVVSWLGVRDVGRRLFGWQNSGQVIAVPPGRHRRSRPSQAGLCQGRIPGRKTIPRPGRRRRGRRRAAGPKFRLGRDRGAARCRSAR